MAAGNRVVNFRTGYVLEYVARGKRSPKREMVTEIVPVTIREVPKAKVALTEGGHPTLFVDRNRLYAEIELPDPSVEAFEAAMRDNEAPAYMGMEVGTRPELVLQGILQTSYGEAPSRDSLDIRSIVEDNAFDGRAHAQAMAAGFLISEGKLLRMDNDFPGISVSALGQKADIYDSRSVQSAFSHNSGYPGDLSRTFRHGDIESANAFIERQAARKGKKLTVQDFRRGSPVNWTKAGLQAECTDAWWVIVTSDTLAANPLRSDEVCLTDLPVEALVALSRIRTLADPHKYRPYSWENLNARWSLPEPEVAIPLALEMLSQMEIVRNALGRDARKSISILTNQIDILVDEGRNHSPSLQAHMSDEDQIALGTFAP